MDEQTRPKTDDDRREDAVLREQAPDEKGDVEGHGRLSPAVGEPAVSKPEEPIV